MVGTQDYQVVAASQTDKQLSGQLGFGAKGDIIEKLVIVPATLGAGSVSIKDGGGTAIVIYNTGTLVDLKPIVVFLNIKSVVGPFTVTTGANVSVIATGRFQ